MGEKQSSGAVHQFLAVLQLLNDNAIFLQPEDSILYKVCFYVPLKDINLWRLILPRGP